MTDSFYFDRAHNGMKGDAFRHILVSLLLRRYLNRPLSHQIMYSWELLADTKGENEPRNRYMDLHNNRIGRYLKYKELRQGTDYTDWARTVHKWIENPGNQAYQEWSQATPTKSEAKAIEKQVAPQQYIYWQKD